MLVSRCHYAALEAILGNEGAHYYICSECGRACNEKFVLTLSDAEEANDATGHAK